MRNTQATPLSVSQQKQIESYGQAEQYAQMYRYIADEIKAGRIAVTGGAKSDQYYWFDQAARINNHDMTSPASYFIRAATKYGLAADGKPNDDQSIQKISNGIGKKVYRDIAKKEALPPFSQQFNADISAATGEGGMTIGGWGGAFYFCRSYALTGLQRYEK